MKTIIVISCIIAAIGIITVIVSLIIKRRNISDRGEADYKKSDIELSQFDDLRKKVCLSIQEEVTEKHSILHKYSDYVNTFLSELQTGYLHFTPPERMKLGKQVMLEAILAKQIEFFKKGIDIDDLDALPIATEMGVKLEGDNFEIKELSQQYKIISNYEPTSWVWKIKPTSTGTQELYLTISIKLKFENYSDATHERPMYIKTINVTVNPIYSIKYFFSNNWKWIISTLFGSGIVFALLKSLKIME